jgi:hypothetical protein
LPDLSNFTKVFSRKTEKEISYTTSESALEELRILEKQKGWAIFEALRCLKAGKADSFSFTKDNPYHYFYARITEENVIFKLKTREKEAEFRIPLEQLG